MTMTAEPTTGQRAALIADGYLVDVTDEARRLRFRHAVAVTSEVWDDCVVWTDAIEQRKTGHSAQEQEARLRDLLCQALFAAKRARGSRTMFYLDRVPPVGEGTAAKTVALVLTIGPGDNAEPVLTVEKSPQQ